MEQLRIADRYEVVRPLGRGSFAQTLLARELENGRLVAIKVLHPRAVHEWKAFELFEREAAVLRGLRHHGVPEVYDAFRASWDGSENAAFLVMEYVEGESLAARIAQHRHLDTADVLHLFVELLGVLDYLHGRVPPLLHRDIKPANIIVRPDGTPTLVDFGAVRNVFRGAEEGGSTIVGSYGYAPYEQFMGQATPSSDLYALGATFLHLVTGRAPPEFMTESGRLEVPSSLSCGEPLRDVLARLLATAPGERYQSAREARAALLMGAHTAEARADAISSGQSKALAPLAAPLEPSRAVALGPTPRPITDEMRRLLRRVGHSTRELMTPTVKPGNRWGAIDWLMVGGLSVLTAGILPLTFWGISRSRRSRLKRFLVHGTPATARVVDMSPEKVAFDVRFTRVRYEFEADGRTYRDSDQALPSIADRWYVGTPIQILYLPDDDYDSVIISTS